MIPQALQEQLNTIAEAKAKELYALAMDVLSRDEFSASGELRDSLKISWFPATDHTPPRILLTYKLQGFILGLKKMSWVKVPNIDKLSSWGEAINFNGPVPGYKGDTSHLPPWKAKQRIINAIAFDKRRNDTWRQRPWKKRMSIGDLIKAINEETLTAWAKDVERILVESISTGKTLS